MYSLILALGTAAATSDTATSTGGSMWTTFITFGVIILIFYFLIIRPQRKRDKEAKAMLDAIKKGDKVVTIGGIRGTVAVVKDGTVILKVDDNTRIEFSKSAISTVLNKKEEAPAAEKPAKKEKVAKDEKPAVEAPKEEEAEAAEAEEAAPEEEKAEN
ncbi:MAG: preprotein translocase subunit YajC [Spirochaetales bacterium]|nr:preprotein translocase subunit YajC [Spirochaetales bacterium]